MQFIQRLRMGGLLSFPPDMEFFELQPLNVLIGPNASGKSNFIEVLELLRATPTDFAAAIRDGGRCGGVGLERRLPTKPCDDHRSRDRSVYDNHATDTDTTSSKVSFIVYHYRSPGQYH